MQQPLEHARHQLETDVEVVIERDAHCGTGISCGMHMGAVFLFEFESH